MNSGSTYAPGVGVASVARAPREQPSGLTFRRAVQAVVLLGFLLTPILNAGEVLALIRGLVRAQQEAYTPLYIKAIKDVCLAVIGLLSATALVIRGRTNILILPFLVLLLYVAASALQASAVHPQLTLAGLRWIFPVMLCFLLIDQVDDGLLTRLAHLSAGLLVLHVLLQIFELFFMSDWFGQTFFGLAGRVPGMFFIPNTAGFFAIMALFLTYFHGKRRTLRVVVYALTPLSIVLTQSGTGIIVYVLLLAMFGVGRFGARRAAPFLLLGPVIAAALLPLLPALTGRGDDYVEVSGGGRIEILMRVTEASDFFPTLFGHATNTAVGFAANLSTIAAQRDLSVITDSTYASIVGNLGLIGLVVFIAAGLLWGLFLLSTPRLELYVFTIVFGLYGATTVITEAYPMSLLFAVLTAYYCQQSFLPFLYRLMGWGRR